LHAPVVIFHFFVVVIGVARRPFDLVTTPLLVDAEDTSTTDVSKKNKKLLFVAVVVVACRSSSSSSKYFPRCRRCRLSLPRLRHQNKSCCSSSLLLARDLLQNK
jgi:hypothetical protein